MRVYCPNSGCPRFVNASTEALGRRVLSVVHVCDQAVDPANDPRRPRSDEHATQMEAARLGLTDQEYSRA